MKQLKAKKTLTPEGELTLVVETVSEGNLEYAIISIDEVEGEEYFSTYQYKQFILEFYENDFSFKIVTKEEIKRNVLAKIEEDIRCEAECDLFEAGDIAVIQKGSTFVNYIIESSATLENGRSYVVAVYEEPDVEVFKACLEGSEEVFISLNEEEFLEFATKF